MIENETSDGKTSGRMLTEMFTDRGSTESTFNSLHERGYSNDDITRIMSDERREKHFSGDTEKTEIRTKAAKGVGNGSAIGSTVGPIAGVIAAIGSSLENIIS